jgi:glyceraldehyde 3-phosphate dehydrogenase
MARVLDVTDEPLVSSDFHGDQHSTVMDLASTRRGPGTQAKVLGWYDNEAGYSARVVDICRLIAHHNTKGSEQAEAEPVTADGAELAKAPAEPARVSAGAS